MTARALFDLVAEAADMHELSEVGSVTVVPVVVVEDDLGPAKLAFRALCRQQDGVFLDAEADQDGDISFSGPVERTANADRVTTLEATLRTRLPVERTVVVAEQSEEPGKVDVQLLRDGVLAEVTNKGDLTVLAVARALAGQAMDSRELAVLAWSDHRVDREWIPRLWELAVAQMEGVPHSTLRTLIVLVQASSIDVRQHCHQESGMQLALEWGRFISRTSARHLASRVKALAEVAKPVTFFLGAGFSASSRLPLGDTLRDSAIYRLMGRDDDPPPSDVLAADFRRFLSQDYKDLLNQTERHMTPQQWARHLTLERVVKIETELIGDSQTLAEFEDLNEQALTHVGAAPRDLARILARHGNRVILTGVNFDTIVEHEATAADVQLKVFASDAEFETAPAYLADYLNGQADAVPYLKLHGTIDRPETCVASDDQVDGGLSTARRAAIQAIFHQSADALPIPWLYVGASMRDRDLEGLFLEEQFVRSVDETWVTPYLPPTIQLFVDREGVREKVWRDTGRRHLTTRAITEQADHFFDRLSAAWAQS